MPKKCKQTLEERKAKAELDQYDIYTINDEMVKRIQKAEEEGNYTPIDDVKAFFDQFR